MDKLGGLGGRTYRQTDRQTTSVHIKYHTPHRKTSHVVSDIMGRLNNYVVDNGVVDIYTSDYTLEYTSYSVPEPDNNPTISTDDDEMYQLLELFHS